MTSVDPDRLGPEMQAALDAWVNGPAAAARKTVVGANPAIRPELLKQREITKVYQALRDYLLSLFHNHCAYCEVDYRSATVQVEHFRPKAKVTEDNQHPGYYWLMFEPGNLLPSCSRCNNRKRNRFPIAGTRAMNVSDNLAGEDPELLNPYIDEDIEAHIQVIADESDPKKFGAVVEVNGSRKGKASILVYGLNDDEKIRARQDEMRAFLREFKDAFDNQARRDELYESLREGNRQCSLACKAMLRAFHARLQRELRNAFGS